MFSRFPPDYDSPSRYEEPPRESPDNMEEPLSLQETVTIFRNAVDSARQAMQQSLIGSEKIGEAIQLKLTIDLNRQRIQTVPSEVSRIMNKDVERCGIGDSLLLPYTSKNEVQLANITAGLCYHTIRYLNCTTDLKNAVLLPFST